MTPLVVLEVNYLIAPRPYENDVQCGVQHSHLLIFITRVFDLAHSRGMLTPDSIQKSFIADMVSFLFDINPMRISVTRVGERYVKGKISPEKDRSGYTHADTVLVN